jgi:hypothetical protein
VSYFQTVTTTQVCHEVCIALPTSSHDHVEQPDLQWI